MKPLGLQVWSVREMMAEDFAGAMKLVADMGYIGVEIMAVEGMSSEEVRKVLDDLGLVVCSTHGRFPTAETISQRIEEAAAWGTDKIISGMGAKAFETEDARKETFDKFAEVTQLCADAGMRFGLHNHWWEFELKVDGKLLWEALLEAVPGMFGQLDTYWAANFGEVDVPAVLARNAARVPSLHLKDGPLVKGEPHMAVGAGKMDIPACVAAADENVLEWVIVELDDCATDMLQAVRESYAYIVGEGLGRGNK